VGHETRLPSNLAEEQLVDALADAAPAPPPTSEVGRAGHVVLAASLVLIAFNLRPVFSSLSVVLPEVMRDTGVSALGASLMTTLPVVCLGIFAPLAARLAMRLGAERVIAALLLVLGLGTALRGLGTMPALLLGSAMAGASIAIVTVLMPGLVKRDFPERAAAMTGLYTMALCGGAAAGAGLTVPIEDRLGGAWWVALAAWSLPALLTAAIWAPQALATRHGESRSAYRVNGLWSDPLAWQVTLFMGLQSALAYCVFGWLAPILRERGLDPVTAGFVVSVSIAFQTFACLVMPSIAVRGRDQRAINVGLIVLSVGSLLACLIAPLAGVWIYAALLGVAQGGLISVILTLIILRSPDARVAAHLSGMAQGVGYVLAATGPLLVGYIRASTGDFRACGVLFIAVGTLAAVNGLGAGRALHVRARAVPVDERRPVA
jgi:CP family cyanate transporter-like MFS transporter